MSEVSTIQFTQDQARTLTGVSVETVRHWRKTIPYLSTRTGKAARFPFTDVVALAITQELVGSLGLHISTLSGGVDALFRLLAKIGPASLEGAVVLITANGATLCEGDYLSMSISIAAPALIVPLTPLVAKIQRQVLPSGVASDQIALPFPPKAVRNRRILPPLKKRGSA